MFANYNTANPGSRPMGIGVESFGFSSGQTNPVDMPIPKARSVWGQLFSTAPLDRHVQTVVPVGLTGNGSIDGLQGQLALSALADFEAAAKKANAS